MNAELPWADLSRWNWNWCTCGALPQIPRGSKQSGMQGSSWSAHTAHKLAFAVKLFEPLWRVLPQFSECLPCTVTTMNNIGHTSMGVITLPKNVWFKYWRMVRYPYSCIWWNGVSCQSPWATRYCNELVINALTTRTMNRSISVSRQSKPPLLRVTDCPRRTLPRRCISYSRVIVCNQLTSREESYKDISEDSATEETRRTPPNHLLGIAAAKRVKGSEIPPR